MAMETINPCAPYMLSPAAWDGVADLCRRVGMDADRDATVVRELKEQHIGTSNWCLPEVKACTRNVLTWYHDRLAGDKEDKRQPNFPLANTFATLVFSLHIASAVIESYFSKTRYCKNQYRARLRDELATATLHLQQLRVFYDVEVLQSGKSLSIDFAAALRRVENNLDDLRRKYLGVTVTKPFFDNTRHTVRDYSGEVTSVAWSPSSGCYLFRIEYDSDSDGEDMEHWELKKYINC